MKAQGIVLATEMESDGIPTCYPDTRSHMGCMLELLPPSQILTTIYDIVAAAAVAWDGSEPIRDMLAAMTE
jgi:hypothetical protein